MSPSRHRVNGETWPTVTGNGASIGMTYLSAVGHKPPLTYVVGRTFRGRLRPVTGHSIVKDERSFIGHCGH